MYKRPNLLLMDNWSEFSLWKKLDFVRVRSFFYFYTILATTNLFNFLLLCWYLKAHSGWRQEFPTRANQPNSAEFNNAYLGFVLLVSNPEAKVYFYFQKFISTVTFTPETRVSKSKFLSSFMIFHNNFAMWPLAG